MVRKVPSPILQEDNPATMPKTFEKARKAIAKKKGQAESLHQYSRDSQRLRRAQGRDEKLKKVAASRRKSDQPYRELGSSPGLKPAMATAANISSPVERAAYFQEALKQNGGQALQPDVVQDLVKTLAHPSLFACLIYLALT